MSDLVTKKKLGGRAGKKKWKKQSDTTGLQLRDLSQARAMSAASVKKTGPLFVINTQVDAKAKAKLDKDRFKAVQSAEPSKAEKKALKKLQQASSRRQEQTQDADVEAEFDVWAADLKQLDIHHDKPVIATKHALEVPKTLVPHAGQSYNPAHQDTLRLMQAVVEKTADKRANFKSKSQKAQERAQEMLKKRPPVKPRTQKEREQLEEQQRAREIKKKEYDAKNVERYFNEARNKQRKHGKSDLQQNACLRKDGRNKRTSRMPSRKDSFSQSRETSAGEGTPKDCQISKRLILICLQSGTSKDPKSR